MICPNCSNPVRDGAAFCPVCGAQITPLVNQPAPQSYQPAPQYYAQDPRPAYAAGQPVLPPVKDPIRINKVGMILVIILSGLMLLTAFVNYAFYDIATFEGDMWSVRFIILDCCQLLLGILPLFILSLMLKKLPPSVMAIPIFLLQGVRVLNMIIGKLFFEGDYDPQWIAYLFCGVAVAVLLFFALSLRGTVGLVLRIVTAVLTVGVLIFYIAIQTPISTLVDEIQYISEELAYVNLLHEIAYLTDGIMYFIELILLAAIEVVLCFTVKERKELA